MAVAKEARGKGLGRQILREAEEKIINRGVLSLKIDTNYDNRAMLHILKTEGYICCGEVYFRGSARKAFEKVLI